MAKTKQKSIANIAVLVGCEDSFGRRFEAGESIADGVLKKADLEGLLALSAVRVEYADQEDNDGDS